MPVVVGGGVGVGEGVVRHEVMVTAFETVIVLEMVTVWTSVVQPKPLQRLKQGAPLTEVYTVFVGLGQLDGGGGAEETVEVVQASAEGMMLSGLLEVIESATEEIHQIAKVRSFILSDTERSCRIVGDSKVEESHTSPFVSLGIFW